jgi:hypothetical protein
MAGSAVARRTLVALLALTALTLVAPGARAADRYDRFFSWSGYRWAVRTTKKPATPGHNVWGDSRQNVRVRGDRTLRVNIFRGKAVEIVGTSPTGYGRYRWVVESDVSATDPFRVAAFFVHGDRGEQDIEFSRWGDPLLTTAGSWVTWRRSRRLGFGFFAVSPVPPFILDIDWMVGATRFTVRDSSRTTLLDTTVPSVGGGRHTAPRISYWLYPGNGPSVNPYTSATVHPPIIVRSFRYRRHRR